ncbi:MAG: DUF2892 domain-containing protein [Jatrophihabitans sp.]|uniref:DUF2892 domain-containing protein n=1 Tax=Jatrophihabitans sp. TaxID=1932789 RepID=UPI003F7CEBEA
MSATQAGQAAVRAGWPLHRILFLLAGTLTLSGVVVAATVSTWFLLVPAMVGVNQLLMVATGWCPMSLLLTRLGARPGAC